MVDLQRSHPTSRNQCHWSHIQHLLSAIRRRIILPSRKRSRPSLHRSLLLPSPLDAFIRPSSLLRRGSLSRLLPRRYEPAHQRFSNRDNARRLLKLDYERPCYSSQEEFISRQRKYHGFGVLQQSPISYTPLSSRLPIRGINDSATNGSGRRITFEDFHDWSYYHWHIWVPHLYCWIFEYKSNKSSHAYDLISCERCHSDFPGKIHLWRYHHCVSPSIFFSFYCSCSHTKYKFFSPAAEDEALVYSSSCSGPHFTPTSKTESNVKKNQ